MYFITIYKRILLLDWIYNSIGNRIKVIIQIDSKKRIKERVFFYSFEKKKEEGKIKLFLLRILQL